MEMPCCANIDLGGHNIVSSTPVKIQGLDTTSRLSVAKLILTSIHTRSFKILRPQDDVPSDLVWRVEEFVQGFKHLK